MGRINTKFAGVFYRDSKTNNKADKTYYIRYKDINQKDTEVKIGKFSEGVREAYCNAKRNEIVTKIRLGETLPNIASKKRINIISVDDIAKSYFEYRELHNSKDIKAEKGKYNNHIKPTFGNKDINSISINDIKKLQRDKAKEFAPKTTNVILDLFSTIFNYAISQGVHTGENYIAKVKRLKVNNTRERYLNIEEIQLLIDTVRNDELLYHFCLVSLSVGGRIGTVLNIKKRDINIGNRTIKLVDFKNNNDVYNGFITRDVAEILSYKLNFLGNNDYLFQVNSKELTVRMLQRRLKPILDELFNDGIDEDDNKNRFVVHSLRHTFASNLAIKGTPIYTIQKLMNHKDITSTLRYAKLDPTNGKDSIDNVMNGVI